MRLIPWIVTSLLLAGACEAQGITLVEGSSLNSLDVKILDEAAVTNSVTLLQAVEFQPLEVTGRSVGHELRTDRSRRVQKNDLWRVELPTDGRLFHYSRSLGQFWGYLLVPDDGMSFVVAEAPGSNGNSPFAAQLAVSADGTRAAVAGAVTGIHVMLLDGTTYASTNGSSRFVPTQFPVIPASVAIGPTHTFFVTTDDRVWRLDLADNSVPVDCTPAPATTNNRLKEEFAMAGSGHMVAFLYGPRDLERIYLLGTTGTSTATSAPPSQYGECDYLPAGTGQPSLLLNDDGSRLFYVDETGSDEMFMLDTTGTLPTLQITSDQLFEPTIGIHILPSFVDATLLVSIGRQDLMEWFRVKLTALGGEVVNLTNTGQGANPQPPYLQGTLKPVNATLVGGKLLATDRISPTNQELRIIDPTTGANSIAFSDLGNDPLAGGSFGIAPDVLIRGTTDRVFDGQTGALRGTLPTGIVATPPVTNVDFGASWISLAGTEWGVVFVFLQIGGTANGGIEFGVRQMALTKQGNVLIDGVQPRLLSPSGLQTLPVAPGIRKILSGAGV